MKKKIMIMSILAVFALIAVSFSAAGLYGFDRTKKESPLYKIRSSQKLNERVQVKVNDVRESLRLRLGERAFLLPMKLFKVQNALSIVICTLGGDPKNCVSLNSQCWHCKGHGGSQTGVGSDNQISFTGNACDTQIYKCLDDNAQNTAPSQLA
ncbi:unnamed protein product, partial [marine sediment metagenome]